MAISVKTVQLTDGWLGFNGTFRTTRILLLFFIIIQRVHYEQRKNKFHRKSAFYMVPLKL